MIVLKKLFLRYLVLVCSGFFFNVVFNNITLFVLLNFLENIFFGATLIIPIFLLKGLNFKSLYFKLSYVVFALCLYIETIYYYLFQTFFSSSAIFVTLDSNTNESKEFLSFYVDLPIIIYSIIFSLIVFFAIKNTKRLFKLKVFPERTAQRIKISLLFLICIVFIKLTSLINFNLPYLILKSVVDYNIESKKLGDYKTNKTGDFNDVYRYMDDQDEVYVIIIGESTARSHMGIYNYYRATTPRLNSIKDELLIYQDVISPHAYSVGALTKILTLGNYEAPELITEGSILQLLNSVGFETYWLSNQRPIGPYESMITKIGLSSKNHEFLTTTLAGNSKVLDGELLAPLNRILREKVSKKVIFVHMMGTHHHYENRYPETFNKFKDTPKTNFKSNESFEKINHYDNAILYNDFIISEIIKQVNSLKAKSFVLYFSDHAEEMYDTINMAGHNEDIYSRQMFEIPFFVWQSNKFKQQENFPFITNRKYMVDDFFHSMADLLDIKAKEIDSTRSIFSKYFKERKRIIKDTVNFDTYFK
ncbi:heptose-I-phosphate ethanolaminephosphotransferase [Jejuia pallidilutea]|uniref:Heptose-I-phosphate ethanolaminephosphotransferase n=1 Tax=Jejuia pallidilutea TaxID=504487 RepID=A0A362WZQ4_9FLAO|nr:sulfatase-like hydrolase/transferase [Jejuia pallidilutea]PQV48204.1 heptose-I-phosphate ethanolaminephosphotransferase [Jejuia pallidilutea]